MNKNVQGEVMLKTSPFLWFNDNAEQAIAFYTSIFRRSQITNLVRDDDHEQGREGNVVAGAFELAGREFLAANGGQSFRFTPAISFFVNCRTEQRIAPFLLFVGKQHGKAEEAMDFYISLFPNSRVIRLDRFGPGEQEREGTVKRAIFSLCGEEFMAMESGLRHRFTFSSAGSFYVSCETQAEVDRLWEKLSAGGEQQQAGWLKDRYGVSWQIAPAIIRTIVQSGDQQKAKQVLRAMMQMTKPDIRRLEDAYRR